MGNITNGVTLTSNQKNLNWNNIYIKEKLWNQAFTYPMARIFGLSTSLQVNRYVTILLWPRLYT